MSEPMTPAKQYLANTTTKENTMNIEVSEHEIVTLADAAAENAKTAINGLEWDEARELIARAETLLAMLPQEEQDDAE